MSPGSMRTSGSSCASQPRTRTSVQYEPNLPCCPLRHRARHEASDLHARWRIGRSEIDGPHHGPAGAVRLADHRFVRHIPPLTFDADPIVAFLCLPIDIRQRGSICVGAARPLPRTQAVEPLLERRAGVAAIDIARIGYIRRRDADTDHDCSTQRHNDHSISPAFPLCSHGFRPFEACEADNGSDKVSGARREFKCPSRQQPSWIAQRPRRAVTSGSQCVAKAMPDTLKGGGEFTAVYLRFAVVAFSAADSGIYCGGSYPIPERCPNARTCELVRFAQSVLAGTRRLVRERRSDIKARRSVRTISAVRHH